MKTQNHDKSDHNAAHPSDERIGVRHSTARAFEHRYERRKIREQLRRLDWVLNSEDAF